MTKLKKEAKDREEQQREQMRDIFLAHEKRVKKELKSLLKKLSPKQLEKEKRFTKKTLRNFNKIAFLVKMIGKLDKDSGAILGLRLNYVKYNILKMKKPKKPVSSGEVFHGDPYTCGPYYFSEQARQDVAKAEAFDRGGNY